MAESGITHGKGKVLRVVGWGGGRLDRCGSVFGLW